MKWKIIILCTALVVAAGGGVFMNTGLVENAYSKNYYPEPCVCSAPADLAVRANRNHRYESSLKAHLEPSFQMSLWNCKCGPLACAVSAQSVSCRK
ncbi:MAG: hypothetical protein NPINA01_22880 [Nitrospinaceae bacterium]|nr:MAG: hypothetical protein NPINA01_22880 [Nitrospinaceae bacterium]